MSVSPQKMQAPTPPVRAFGDGSRRRALLGLGIALSALFGLLLVLVEQHWGPLMSLDRAGRDGLHDYFVHHDNQVQALKGVSRAATAPVYAVLFALVVAWLWRQRRTQAATFVVVTVTAGYF